MNNLACFEFNSNQVRVVVINNEPWFVASDVCKILEHTNTSVAIGRLDDDEKQQVDPKQCLDSVSNQDLTVISESGLYNLVFSSRKPESKPFKKWVTSEVLPSIRKTGSYALISTDPIDAMILGLQEIKKLQKDQELLRQQLLLEAEKTQRLEEIIEHHDSELDRIFHPDGNYFSIRAYAKVIGMKTLGISEANRLGRKASRLSKSRNVTVDKLPDPRYGEVNAYSENIF